ncbi:hypothetical protein CPB85DRAFT_92605 [Mucidula mucida]|nr:hypothetical protein CPB85DRAFT_92605 [Mucidula mucida]
MNPTKICFSCSKRICFSVIRMVNAFSELLIKAKWTVVNIGSVTAFVPLAFIASYNASKAALLQYSDTVRIELAPFEYALSLHRESSLELLS